MVDKARNPAGIMTANSRIISMAIIASDKQSGPGASGPLAGAWSQSGKARWITRVMGDKSACVARDC